MVGGTVLKRGGKLIADMGKAKKVLAESYQHIVDQVSKTKVQPSRRLQGGLNIGNGHLLN